MKVVVAMSGGVDSSVAAYLLKKAGHDVTGLSFELWDRRDIKTSSVCCSIETIQLAKKVARRLGIDHHTTDVRDAFYSKVIEPFCDSYMEGTTPNPCILCNKFIKFDFLLDKAKELGADKIATGHYARIKRDESTGRFLLLRAVDSKKDQSYVLYVMTPVQLSHTIFPLGEMSKDETRKIAASLDLETAIRPESQEICFAGDDRYSEFIREFAPDALKPGPVVDRNGNELGRHNGIAFYTIGQRRGLGIAAGKPIYVIRIDKKHNTIVVGSRDDAMAKSFKVNDLNWISCDPMTQPTRVTAKIRSTMMDKPCTIFPVSEHSVSVEFDEAQWAPAAGQSAVFYDGDVVLGGGIIELNP